MKERVMVIAPHPDDETLGAGGTLLRMKAERYPDDIHQGQLSNKNQRWSYN